MNKQKFGKDNWLHIITNAIANYVDEGGEVDIVFDELTGSMQVSFSDVAAGDSRLNGAFVAMVDWKRNADHNEMARWLDQLVMGEGGNRNDDAS